MTPSWLLDLLAAIMLVVAVASVIRLAASALAAGRPWRPVLIQASRAPTVLIASSAPG